MRLLSKQKQKLNNKLQDKLIFFLQMSHLHISKYWYLNFGFQVTIFAPNISKYVIKLGQRIIQVKFMKYLIFLTQELEF